MLNRFEEKVKKIEEFVNALNNFDKTLKDIGTTYYYFNNYLNFKKHIAFLLDSWMKEAETQLHDIKNNSDKMTPEDRVSYTMDLREDIHDKVDVLLDYVKQEEELLPQGN